MMVLVVNGMPVEIILGDVTCGVEIGPKVGNLQSIGPATIFINGPVLAAIDTGASIISQSLSPCS